LTNTDEDALSTSNDIQGKQVSNEPVIVIDSTVALPDVSQANQPQNKCITITNSYL
jgi:hypothetical protein